MRWFDREKHDNWRTGRYLGAGWRGLRPPITQAEPDKTLLPVATLLGPRCVNSWCLAEKPWKMEQGAEVPHRRKRAFYATWRHRTPKRDRAGCWCPARLCPGGGRAGLSSPRRV